MDEMEDTQRDKETSDSEEEDSIGEFPQDNREDVVSTGEQNDSIEETEIPEELREFYDDDGEENTEAEY